MKLLRSNYMMYIIGVICIIAIFSCSILYQYVSYYKQFNTEVLIDKSEI